MCAVPLIDFGLRDYGMEGQIGAETTPAAFVSALVAVFEEVRRVLTADGTCWLNLGPSYANSVKPVKQFGEVGAAVMPGADEPFALRDDLTREEMAYVLSEMSASICPSHEIPLPNITIGIDKTVTSLTSSEKV